MITLWKTVTLLRVYVVTSFRITAVSAQEHEAHVVFLSLILIYCDFLLWPDVEHLLISHVMLCVAMRSYSHTFILYFK